MRAPVKHRLKIAYEDLKAINPRLVYGSISGFGQDGPYAMRAGVDQIAQGLGGLMSITGEPGRGPMRAGIAISDVTAGTLLALAIMMALYDRQRTRVTNPGDKAMSIHLQIVPIVSIIAGILILAMPKILNYIVAIYLIVVGVVGLGVLS